MNDFITKVTTDRLLLTAIVFIFVFFIYACFCLLDNRKSEFKAQIVAIAPTTLTSIGIFFTFLGISIVLFNYDDSVESRVPTEDLVEGARLAFVSSVIGLALTVLFRFFVAAHRGQKSKREGKPAELGIQDLYDQLHVLNYNTLSVRDALVGEGEASLSTQFGKLRIDFKDYATNVRKDGTQELVKALEEVIREFNVKITEQFGDNFKQLNEAVAKLLIWQQEYKTHVETLTKAFTEVQSGIENVEKSVAKIPVHMFSVETAFNSTEERVKQLYEGIGSLDELRNSAKDLIPEIQNSIDMLSKGIRNSIDTQVKALEQQIVEIQNLSTNNTNKVDELTTIFTDTIKESVNELKDTAKETTPAVKNVIDELAKSIGKSVETQVNALEQQIFEIQNLSTNNTNKVDELTTKFTDTIKESVNELRDTAKETTPAVKNVIDELAKSVGKSVETQVNALEQQIVEIQNLSTSNTNKVDELTTKFTDAIKESVSELKDTAKEATPAVKNAIDELTTSIGKSIDTQVKVLEQQTVEVSSIIQKQITSVQDLQNSNNNEIKIFARDLNNLLDSSLKQTENAMNEQITQFKKITDEITRGINQMHESSIRLSEKATSIVEEFYSQQDTLTKRIHSKIENTIDMSSKSISQGFEDMDSNLQEEVRRVVNKMGDSLVAITKEFVTSYEELHRIIKRLNETDDTTPF